MGPLPTSWTRPGALRRRLRLHLLPNHFPALHGLRVLGIVSVLQYHLTMMFVAERLLPPGHPLAVLSLRSWFGMDLFFVLSGFLIGSMLMPRPGAKPPALGLFYLRRSFRIIPPYWVVLTLMVGVWSLGLPSLHISRGQWANLPYEYLYLRMYVRHTDDPPIMGWAWSLMVEEHFYLLVPLVTFALSRLPRPALRSAVLVAGIASAAVVRWSLWSADPSPAAVHRIYFFTHTRYDTLLTGILLAQVLRDHGPGIRAALLRPMPKLVLSASAAASLAALLWPYPLLGFYQVVFAWGTVTSCLYFPLVLLLVAGDTWLGRLLSGRWALRIATLGYGIYLVHPPVVGALAIWFAGISRAHTEVPLLALWGLWLGAIFAVSTALAFVLHVLIEKPALWLRDRVA